MNKLPESIGRKVGCQEKSDNFSTGHQGHSEVWACLLFYIEGNAFYLIFKVHIIISNTTSINIHLQTYKETDKVYTCVFL